MGKEYRLPPDVTAAAKVNLRVGAVLSSQRSTGITKRRTFANSLVMQSMDAELKDRANPPENVRRLHKGVNVAFLGLLPHAIRGVDQSLPHNMLHGFPIIHDVPDSGVYRATDHPLTLDEFCDVYDAIMLTNEELMEELKRRMRHKYDAAMAASLKGDSRALDLMKEVERLTLLEVPQGLCAPGLDDTEFRDKFTNDIGDLQARPMPRHGVFQGKKVG